MNELAAENQADFLCFYKWSHLQINTKSYLYWWTNISIQQENSFEVKRFPVLQKEALYLVWIRQVDHQTRRHPGPWKSLDRVPLYQRSPLGWLNIDRLEQGVRFVVQMLKEKCVAAFCIIVHVRSSNIFEKTLAKPREVLSPLKSRHFKRLIKSHSRQSLG